MSLVVNTKVTHNGRPAYVTARYACDVAGTLRYSIQYTDEAGGQKTRLALGDLATSGSAPKKKTKKKASKPAPPPPPVEDEGSEPE
jgi:hypothetical protein